MIKIFTNEVQGGWQPQDLEKGLGGSEECVVELARAIVRQGFEVIVYHTPAQKYQGMIKIDGVVYTDRNNASCDNDDIFITFKDPTPFIRGAYGAINIHWSADVEIPWNVDRLDAFVNLSNFHQARNGWVPPEKSRVIPLGIDVSALDVASKPQEGYKGLYCSSPDRGLVTLLKDWPKIREHSPTLELIVCYGHHPERWYHQFKQALTQEGISYYGAVGKSEIEQLYWECRFWFLPLNRADSELFCLNAVKAQLAGAIPVVNKIGALTDTVGPYIKYEDFVLQGEKNKLNDYGAEKPVGQRWDVIAKEHWLPMFMKPSVEITDASRIGAVHMEA